MTSALAELEIPNDASAAEWINAEIRSFGNGTVAGVVPERFEAYAKIFHPVKLAPGRYVRWSEIASLEGKEMEAGALWFSSRNEDALGLRLGVHWTGDPSARAGLRPLGFQALCSVLGQHTAQEKCFLGLWDGFDAVEYWPIWHRIGLYREGLLGTPARFGVPSLVGRDYFLLRGSLSVAVQMMLSCVGGLGRRSPHFIWPDDRSWLVVSDRDLDSTIVGGSAELVDDIVESQELEAWRAEPQTAV